MRMCRVQERELVRRSVARVAIGRGRQRVDRRALRLRHVTGNGALRNPAQRGPVDCDPRAARALRFAGGRVRRPVPLRRRDASADRSRHDAPISDDRIRAGDGRGQHAAAALGRVVQARRQLLLLRGLEASRAYRGSVREPGRLHPRLRAVSRPADPLVPGARLVSAQAAHARREAGPCPLTVTMHKSANAVPAPGYSGTPLAKKLGVEAGSNLAPVGVPKGRA